jgi:hypothetical protein
MSIRRRSTIHDLASLRLHPDGSRVQNPHIKEDELELDASQQNLSSRRAHYVGKDAKGNWIAKDAGGRGFVKEIKAGSKRKSNANSSDEEIQLDSERRIDDPEGEAEQEGKKELKDARAKKRRMFYEDYSFLEDAGSTAGPSRSVSLSLPPQTQDELGVPSSVSLNHLPRSRTNQKYLRIFLKVFTTSLAITITTWAFCTTQGRKRELKGSPESYNICRTQ